MRKDVNKKSNNKSKVVSALAMLLVSAVALSSASYAWFTMSKQVEVKGIELTATAPDNVLIATNSETFDTITPYASTKTLVVAADAQEQSTKKDVLKGGTDTAILASDLLLPSSSTDGLKLYDTESVKDTGEDLGTGKAKYKESSIVLMDKSKFFICPLGLKKSIDDEYIILVDGVFDSISLAQEGYNSISILGSTISEYNRFILSLVKNVYVAYDNDGAGRRLYESLKRIHSNVYSITQSKCKDIDDFIKQYPDDFKREMSKLSSKVPMSFHLKVE